MVVTFLLLGAVAKALSFSSWIAIIAALMIALAAKSAFIDSFMLVEMMTSYMKVAPSTQITYDLYGKLCGLSNEFKELFGKAQQEQPNLSTTMASQQASVAATVNPYGQTTNNNFSYQQSNMNLQQGGARYCTHCGTLMQGQFCTSCGNRVN